MNFEQLGFRDPAPHERPLRILVYGLTKTGKSHLIYTGADVGPLFWQDSEGGADLYPNDRAHKFHVLPSKDPWKTVQTVERASAMFREGEPRPIVAVDSMSSVWFQQQEVAKQVGGGRQRIPFWAWGPAKEPLKKLYDRIHTSRCHVIITARAKMSYEVSDKGEPTEKGLVADVERNLAYSMDLILLTHVAEINPDKPRPLEPEDFMATVVGTRSPSVDGKAPPVPIGRVFHNPKFSDFMEVMVEGAPFEGIEDTAREQSRMTDWSTLESWLENHQAWTVDKARAALYAEFGTFDKQRVSEYYQWLKTHQEKAE